MPDDSIDAAAEGDGLADEGGIGSQTLPERIGDDGERLARVAEPLPGLRVHADTVRQGRRDLDSVEELRLPGGREIVVGELDPAEYVEAPHALLVLGHVVQIQARHVCGISQGGAEDGRPSLAMLVGEGLQQQRIDHGIDRGGRSDADGEGHDDEKSDGLSALPGLPGLRGDGHHAGVILALKEPQPICQARAPEAVYCRHLPTPRVTPVKSPSPNRRCASDL